MEMKVTPWVSDHKGISWCDAPLPRRWHFCQPWTVGQLSTGEVVCRCACGALKRADWRNWIDKNERRKR